MGLPFYLDENISGKRDVTLHNSVRELELIRDANLASLYLPLLFPCCSHMVDEFDIEKFGIMVTLQAITKQSLMS